MSTQKAFADIVAAMRKAVKRTAGESDSEDSIDITTNRGNKLRKKAKYVHEGQLAPPNGPQVYKRTVTFGEQGYQRDVISHKPALYDDEGYEVDSEEDDERVEAATANASELYPYADIRIEELLGPLLAPADLPNHPALSRPYTSNTLTELTRNAREMVQKEKASLWRMKHLLTKFSGDHEWIPSEMFETENDISLFGDGRSEFQEHLLLRNSSKYDEQMSIYSANAELKIIAVEPTPVVSPAGENLADEPVEPVGDDSATQDDIAMIDAPEEPIQKTSSSRRGTNVGDVEVEKLDTEKDEMLQSETAPDPDDTLVEDEEEGSAPKTDVLNGQLEPETLDDEDHDGELAVISGSVEDDEIMDGDGDEEEPAPRRMRTRAQAQAASDNTNMTRSITPESNESYVHPYFLAPPSAHPDRDIGLPPTEAEETRRLLQLYIQKQEEICRGAEKVYDGLLKADRLRKTVMKWAKAEGHIGELSDGEDWYDKEEWGLTEDLKKGQDEEEEDAATTAKKTRTRRQ